MIQITPPPISSQAMADLLCTIIIFCRGVDRNKKPVWAYMYIKPSMAESFKQAREKGAFKLEEYGTVLESGEGVDAPEDVKARMERDYGVKHDYEEQLLKAIESNKKLAEA